jgi:hypothetical protein
MDRIGDGRTVLKSRLYLARMNVAFEVQLVERLRVLVDGDGVEAAERDAVRGVPD